MKKKEKKCKTALIFWVKKCKIMLGINVKRCEHEKKITGKSYRMEKQRGT